MPRAHRQREQLGNQPAADARPIIPGLHPRPFDQMPCGLQILPDLVEPSDGAGLRREDAKQRGNADAAPDNLADTDALDKGTNTEHTAVARRSGESSTHWN